MAAIAVAMLIIAAAWALSLMIRLMLSRTREYLADAGSVELTKNPDAMISALRKVAGKGEIEGATSGVMEMCLDNPRSGFADLFSSHPAIEDRIEALQKYAGGMEELPAPQATRFNLSALMVREGGHPASRVRFGRRALSNRERHLPVVDGRFTDHDVCSLR